MYQRQETNISVSTSLFSTTIFYADIIGFIPPNEINLSKSGILCGVLANCEVLHANNPLLPQSYGNIAASMVFVHYFIVSVSNRGR
mmetsp:Transcript_7487/g.11107  ORF Transcript_7487/g.11107 Transcript_7487/m.11107 type:complete len:86 (+) Transcript_7487:689-946(+)